MNCKSIALLSLCLVLGSCTNHKENSNSNQKELSFVGSWQGNGTDSKGNPFKFFARVSHSGDNKYRMLILADLEIPNEPMHIMDGVLEDNKFSYTADEGLYKGEGTLSKDRFEGYYKGPIDGTFKMWRIDSKNETK